MKLEDRIGTIIKLGKSLEHELDGYETGSATRLGRTISQAQRENPWFDEESVLSAMRSWVIALQPDSVEKWIKPYEGKLGRKDGSLVGVVNAGNIPFVGLHDLISILIAGHSYTGKNATGDSVLMPFIVSLLVEADPSFGDKIKFVDRLQGMNAVIATGSNNSARYFEYYFGKYPHIIRKNRNGIAILDGSESISDLKALGRDIFSFYGLGCRNVSKVYVPKGYDFKNFFESIYDYSGIMSNSKYMNNFDYNNSVLLLKQIPFLSNGFLIIREENQIPSPVSVVHWESYDDISSLEKELLAQSDQLQCIATNIKLKDAALNKIKVDFGKTQEPALWDYADGVDTLEFLTALEG